MTIVKDKLALSVKGTAEALDIGTSKVYQMVASGELPSIRIGGSVRVPVDALKAWVQERSEIATNARPIGVEYESSRTNA